MGSAVVSPCGRYRYTLERDVLGGQKIVAFIMLNPSTADSEHDDPTIRRCKGFAFALEGHRLLVGNLFAYRATDPAELYVASLARTPASVDIVGPDNDRHLRAIIARADVLIAAWGACGKLYKIAAARSGVVAAMASEAGKELQALKLTAGGHPGHPLYLRADARPFQFEARRVE